MLTGKEADEGEVCGVGMCVDMFRDGSELGVGRVRELCYERLREQAKIKGNESVNGKGFQRWFFKICPWTLAFNYGFLNTVFEHFLSKTIFIKSS